MSSRMEAAWRKIDSHDQQLDQLGESLSKMAKTAGFLETIARWLLGIITALIIALAVAFVTGRIDVVFK
jgi:hypothetical protein